MIKRKEAMSIDHQENFKGGTGSIVLCPPVYKRRAAQNPSLFRADRGAGSLCGPAQPHGRRGVVCGAGRPCDVTGGRRGPHSPHRRCRILLRRHSHGVYNHTDKPAVLMGYCHALTRLAQSARIPDGIRALFLFIPLFSRSAVPAGPGKTSLRFRRTVPVPVLFPSGDDG